MKLPARIEARAFDALHDDPAAWRDIIVSLAREHGAAPADVTQAGDGTVLVALLGGDRVIKLFPPFLRDHFDFECAMLGLLHRRLSVPTPELLATGNRDGWPYLVETQLHGEQLDRAWPRLAEAARLALLEQIGALIAEVHALPVATLLPLTPRWPAFIGVQRERCHARQQRTDLPAHLLAQLAAFVAGALPQGPAVPLTGEYSPWNLFVRGARLAAMFDFGDGLVGPREYDLLGPLCFFAAGRPERVHALLAGYGAPPLDAAARQAMLRLLLLHRYSNLKLQLALEGWQQAPDFETLAEWLWGLRR